MPSLGPGPHLAPVTASVRTPVPTGRSLEPATRVPFSANGTSAGNRPVLRVRRSSTVARGKLRLYLGAAPGVGKTYAMLNEGWRRKERGTDVVVGWVQEHGRPHTDAQIRDLEVFPRTHRRVPGPDLRGDGRRRPAGPQAGARPGGRAGPHQRPRVEARQALAGRGGAARRRHQRHLDGQPPAPRVAQRRGRADHRGDPAGDGPRPGGAGGRPDRAGRHGPRGPAPAAGPRQRLSRPSGSTPPWPTTSAPATSPRCGSWPCCGWPTGSTRSSTTTGSATTSPGPGRPRSGWWSPSPARRAVPSSSGGPPGWPCGPRPSWSASTSAPTTA